MKNIFGIFILLAAIAFACKKSTPATTTAAPTPTACFSPLYNHVGLQVYDTFKNCSTNAATYSWDFGDSTNSTLQNPSHIYNNPGTYNVKLTVYNSDKSQSATVTKPVTVDTIYNAPVSCGTADPSSIALHDTVQCDAYCSQYATSFTWQDVTVSGPVHNGAFAKIPMPTGGTHDLVLTAYNKVNGKSATSHHAVVVN